MAATYNYDDTLFRTQFPAFEDATAFPTPTLQMYWDSAGTIITNTTYGAIAQQGGPMALNLMTAHLAALSVMIANNELPAIPISAGIDKINITTEPPPLKTQFQYWLSTTPYGQQLLAMLQVASVGGLYVPGGLGKQGFTSPAMSRYR